MGRPTKYSADKHDDLVCAYAACPKTDAEIAKAMHIADSTLRLWLKEHESFSAAHKVGRAELLDRVEKGGMYARALGYEYTETSVSTEEFISARPGSKKYKAAMRAASSAEPGEHVYQVKRTSTLKHVAADVGAAVFVLCNRRPKGYDVEHLDEGWRHVQRIEHTGADSGPVKNEITFAETIKRYAATFEAAIQGEPEPDDAGGL